MNELIKVNPSEALSLGKTFFESGMFADVRSAQQAVVKIMAGQELGIGAFTAMSGIHIISGKPAIGAGLMASQVKGSGKYDYKVTKHDDKICSIDFYQGKEMIGNSTFTIEDAKKAGTKNLDKFPKNMLFARALSNGVKWFTPDVFTGPVYVPEEMNNTEDVTPTEVSTAPTEPKPLPTLTTSSKKYDLVVERLRNCTTTVDQVKTYFTLTNEMEEALSAIEKAAQTEAAEEKKSAPLPQEMLS
jgi:hypothetical protein